MKEILLDTNILIYTINESSLYHTKAKRFINNHLSALVVSDQTVNEALRILTHNKFARPLTSRQAMRAVKNISNECTHISPNLHTRNLFFDLVKKYNVTSNNIYDAYLAATALSNSISQIATNNAKDFKIFKEIKLVKF